MSITGLPRFGYCCCCTYNAVVAKHQPATNQYVSTVLRLSLGTTETVSPIQRFGRGSSNISRKKQSFRKNGNGA